MKRFLIPLLILVIGSVDVFLLFPKKEHPPSRPVIAVSHQKKPSPPAPALLPPRRATAENPQQSWERLLAADGTPSEDRAALADIVTNFLESTAPDQRHAMGTNEEITRKLSDPSQMGGGAIPLNHPAMMHGQLVDRWGSPWFFHQQSSNVIEVRSAGPDHKLFTDDDVTK